MRRVKKQEQAVARIRHSGGHATYDYQLNSAGDRQMSNRRILPKAIQEIVGDGFLSHVERVSLHAPFGSDADLEPIGSLPAIVDLRINSRHFTNEGLRHLQDLENLERLDLWCRQITDEGLRRLSGLDSLIELDLSRTQITDAGLEHLQTLANLRTLKARGTGVTSRGAASLENALPGCTVYGASDSP